MNSIRVRYLLPTVIMAGLLALALSACWGDATPMPHPAGSYGFAQCPDDPGSLYIQINGTKIPYSGNALTANPWTVWNVDLASAGVNLSQVTSLGVGVDTAGSGMILVDEIRLYKTPPGVVVATDPGGRRIGPSS